MEPPFSSIVTVDGPTGSGKTALLRGLSQLYGCQTLEFGVLVRAIAWRASTQRVPIADAVAQLAAADARGSLSMVSSTSFTASASHIAVDHVRVTRDLFGRTLGRATSEASHDAEATLWATELVRSRIRHRQAAVSGREAAVTICPEAPLNIWLECEASERASRKASQRLALGLGPLWLDDRASLSGPAEGAVHIDTTHRAESAVLGLVSALVENRLGWARTGTRPLVLSMVA